jgi:hypothetical protein
VVVGDRRQLPPTRFFQATTLDTAGDDPDEEPPESVLDACLDAGLPQCSLLWHYRSRHEHLIAFSNAAFYEGRLRTFPSPDADERVVSLIHVPDGVYDRGGTRVNRAEAIKVADLVVEHVEGQAARPVEERLSLGVIAFSEAQMLAILSEIEARKRARPELEPLLAEDDPLGGEGFFVKNLESVQGDERDVILFSIGYGPDADGRLAMSFGPLNAPGGERRLNVAVTRARQRLTVVSSIRAHEIDASPERPSGVRQLRRYLEYAEHGPSTLLGATAGTGSGASSLQQDRSPFEEAVQAALTDVLRGHDAEVVARVGVGEQPVDLAIRDRDGRFLLAIETDGETFAALPTARDRVRLRREVLERLGWQVHRVWSTAWIAGQREEQQRVVAAFELARQIRDGVLPDETPLSVLKPEDRPSQGPARPHRRPPGEPASVSRGRPAAVVSEPASPMIPAAETGVIAPSAAETSPTVPEAAGTSLTSPEDAEADARSAPAVRADIQPTEALAAGSAAVPVPQAYRPINRVPAEEIADAVRAVLARAFAMSDDDLTVAVARELGYHRTGGRIKAAVGRVTRQMLQEGALAESGGHLRLHTPDT